MYSHTAPYTKHLPRPSHLILNRESSSRKYRRSSSTRFHRNRNPRVMSSGFQATGAGMMIETILFGSAALGGWSHLVGNGSPDIGSTPRGTAINGFQAIGRLRKTVPRRTCPSLPNRLRWDPMSMRPHRTTLGYPAVGYGIVMHTLGVPVIGL